MKLVLASSSESRLNLLKKINITPDEVFSPNVDETPIKQELPRNLALRVSKKKALFSSENFNNAYIIAADTVGCVGRYITEKATSSDIIEDTLKLLSGRRHKVYTAVCILKKTNEDLAIRQKIVCSIVKFKRLTEKEISDYLELKLGFNTATAYALEELYIEKFIPWISGSISNIKGLPIYETSNMLKSLGYCH